MAQAWPVLGEVIDGVFVFRELIPPYIEVASGNLRGQFSTTYLTDESCEDCYDVNVHMVALNNLGLTVGESSTFDVSSDQGKELLDKYSITKVPTIILSGDLSEYQGLQQVWPLVGEVTSDGSYVFTKMEEMGTYRDLDTGEVVEVELPEATPEATPEVIPEVVQ